MPASNPLTYYSGPAKVYFNSLGFQAAGESGQVTATLTEKTSDVATAQFGKIAEQLDDVTGEISLTPFDDWSLLRTLFPAYLGVTCGVSAGVLLIGTRPHGAANAATKIWTPDGRLYNFIRTAIVGHPTLKLNSGEPLFGPIKIAALGDPTLAPGASEFLLAGSAITESAGSDPGGAMALTNFIRGRWFAAWGTLAGFGGGGSDSPMEAEEGWELVPDVKYSARLVQKVTRHMVLDSVAFMLKGRPVGPTQSQIAGALLAHTAGSRFGAGTNGADLILTGPSSKTITLKKAEIKGAGFEFGGTKLGNGEVGFVSTMSFTAGAADPLLVFSA